jgi:crotonobetainyl-CoA:carnitine CoA-transferase CaiB-like acyl-CoA transferase
MVANSQSQLPGPLTGIRVLDLAVGTPGELSAMVFGDLGADVIRVDWSGAADHGPGSVMWNRNKRIVAQDLSSPEVGDLIGGADVVVTSSAGATQIVEAAAAENTRLVHLRVERFRASEAVNSQVADAMMTAATGIARRQASSDGGPVESVVPYLSYEQGLWAATCAVAALVERERTGIGQRVSVDGMHAALIASAVTIVVDPDAAPLSTAYGPSGPNPTYSNYRCSDGEWIFVGALLPKFKERLFELLDTSDIWQDPRIAGDDTKLYAVENRDWVRARLSAVFSARSREEWLAELTRIDIPASVLAPPGQFLDHPQVEALGQRRSFDDPVLGRVEVPWFPVGFSKTPAVSPSAGRPVPSARWLERSAGDGVGAVGYLPATQTRSEGPLGGLHVLDLGAVLAGPLAGTLLAELGADVTKVEPLEGAAQRELNWQVNRGQQSLSVNLRDPDGHAVFASVVETADAVLDNFRPGVLARLDIAHDALAKVKPDIVTASITAYGDTGPYAGLPGFDPILQAASGMMTTQGGHGDPVFSTLAVNDVTSACATALGVCAALYHRARTGEGQRLEVTMVAVAAFMQADELVRYPGRPAYPLGGRNYKGSSPLDRYYETRDGWIRAYWDSPDTLAASGLAATEPDGAAQLAEQIALALRKLDTSQAIALISDGGGHATRATMFRDLVRDPEILARSYYQEISRPADGKKFYMPGRHAVFGRTQNSRAMSPPGLGENSREILGRAGISAARIDHLVASRVVADGGPMTMFDAFTYR